MLISPSSPFSSGSLVHFGVKHPQPASTSRINNGVLSLFVNLNTAVTGFFQMVEPAFTTVLSNEILCARPFNENAKLTTHIITYFLLILLSFLILYLHCVYIREASFTSWMARRPSIISSTSLVSCTYICTVHSKIPSSHSTSSFRMLTP